MINNISKRFFSSIALAGAALLIAGCASTESHAGNISIGINVPLGNGVSSTITYGTGNGYHNNGYYNNGYSSHYYRGSPPPVIYSNPGYVYPNRPIIINNGRYDNRNYGHYDNRPIIIDNRSYNRTPRPIYVVPKNHRQDRRNDGVWR